MKYLEIGVAEFNNNPCSIKLDKFYQGLSETYTATFNIDLRHNNTLPTIQFTTCFI